MKKFIADERANDPRFVLDYDGAEEAVGPSHFSLPVDGARHQVVVKRDCDEDDPDAER